MKITDIKPYPVWVGHRNQHIVKVETDAGIYGVNEELVTSQTFKFSEPPHLRRRDRSHTNW